MQLACKIVKRMIVPLMVFAITKELTAAMHCCCPFQLGHVLHPLLFTMVGAPTPGADYLLVQNLVFQLEPYGLGYIYMTSCACLLLAIPHPLIPVQSSGSPSTYHCVCERNLSTYLQASEKRFRQFPKKKASCFALFCLRQVSGVRFCSVVFLLPGVFSRDPSVGS